MKNLSEPKKPTEEEEAGSLIIFWLLVARVTANVNGFSVLCICAQ
jgi:hypothetical protein